MKPTAQSRDPEGSECKSETIAAPPTLRTTSGPLNESGYDRSTYGTFETTHTATVALGYRSTVFHDSRQETRAADLAGGTLGDVTAVLYRLRCAVLALVHDVIVAPARRRGREPRPSGGGGPSGPLTGLAKEDQERQGLDRLDKRSLRRWSSGRALCGRVVGCGRYVCRSANGGCGRISRKRETVHTAVTEAVLRYFDSMTLVEEEWDDDLMPKIARAQAKVAEIQAAYDQDLIDIAGYAASMKAPGARWRPSRSTGLPGIRASARKAALVDPGAAWEGANLARRRLLIDQVVESVVIGPVGRGRRDPLSSISIAWAG